MAEDPPPSRYSIVVLSAPAETQSRSMLPIAQELNRRDHRITYVTTQEFAARAVIAGVDVLVHESCPTYGRQTDLWECSGPADPVCVEATLDWAEAIYADFADDVPDLVLYEASTRITARLLTFRWNRPAVQIYPSFANGDVPVRDDAAVSDSGIDECVSDLPADIRERLFRFLSPAEQAGLTPSDFYTRPEPLSIALLPREFQADGHLFDSRVAFVGPCIPERRMNERWQLPATGLPVVCFALDPELLGADADFLRSCVDALAGQPLHAVIMTNSNSEGVLQAAEQLPNVEVHEWVPRSVVLRCAAAFVCHSDLNSVMESLYFNTPLVAVPTCASERAVADRVVELGLGVQMPPEAAGPQSLVDAVVVLVGDLETGRQVRALQRQARRAGGARRAADEIERYLEWIYEP
ncbi:hypothetical protein NRF20_39215 [Streptomyces sp. R-74717]|uniref:nucleotide disphospho-sugar-binding domain-containing protein n=1 Tax=Streptomyces TaxID=1883 RepID=UPI0037B9153F